MGAAYLSGFLLNPLVLGSLLLVVAGMSSVHYGPERAPIIPRHRLVVGYALAVIACVVVSAALSYVSPEEALQRWKVPPENYWSAQVGNFLATLSFGLYGTLLGIAAIGLPITLFLARCGLASVPTVLLAAVGVSLSLAGVMAAGNTPPFRHFNALAQELVFAHVVVAAAFCIGAGIPWSISPRVRT